MVNVCESLLDSVKNYFKQDKRSNAELNDKLHQLFQDNLDAYGKFAMWYGENSSRKDIFGKLEYEFNEMEKLRKRMYGDDYEIKSFIYG